MKNAARNPSPYHGVVVPMVTPLTAAGDLDETALARLIDTLLAGGVEGIFVLGTTGEGAHVPRELCRRLVRRGVERVRGRAKFYAGMGDMRSDDLALAQEYFDAGVDAVVAHPPISSPLRPEQLPAWFESLLDHLRGPLLLYNMPATTNISIPLDLVGKLIGHPHLIGIKDSENDPLRHEELLRRFGRRPGFSIFIGVGALMAEGLKSGADGIMPSVGNLIPRVCHRFYESARQAEWSAFDTQFARMNAVAAFYQKGRTLGESIAALKAAVHCRGLCSSFVLPPLRSLSEAELENLRREMIELQLIP